MEEDIADNGVMSILDMYDSGDAIADILEQKKRMQEACNLEQVISDTGELTNDIIASVESAFPGMLLDNLTLSQCQTPEGVTYALESLADTKDKAAVSVSVASILLINNLKTFLKRIKDSEIGDGVGSMMSIIGSGASSLKETIVPGNETKYLNAYKAFMGEKAESIEMVADMLEKMKSYKSPIQVLKDFPNSEYNVMFTPLLSDTIAEKSPIFDLFRSLHDSQAATLVKTVDNVQDELTKIAETNDYGRLARFNDTLIPKEINDTLNAIVASYKIDINPKVPLLNQTGKIGKQFAQQLKPNSLSLDKKPAVVHALVFQHKKLDEAYNNILKATDILSQFDKVKSEQLLRLQKEMVNMQERKSLKARAVGIKDGSHAASKMQYRRVLDEIEQLWALVSLFARMSVVYVTKHAIIVKTLTEFNLRLSQFIKTTSALEAKGV